MMEKWLMLMSIKCFKSAVSINTHRFTTTTNNYLGHHETVDYNVLLSWKVCSASIKCIIISVISVSWSLFLSLPPPYDLVPPLHWPDLFFLVSEGENWRGGGGFLSVRMQQNVTNWSADCLYLSANSGRTICTAVQQKHQSLFIPSLALDMESHKCTIVFSSLLWAQQSISDFIAIQFYRVYAPLQLSHKINACVSDCKFILLFCKI